MTYLSQGRNSDYEQIDLINSEVVHRPVGSACNSLYQSIYFEEESQPELNLQQEKQNGLQEAKDQPVARACKSLYQSIDFEEMSQPEVNPRHEKDMQSSQKDDTIPSILQHATYQHQQKEKPTTEYQNLHEDYKGKNIQAASYQPLQREQHYPEYINQSYKKNNKEAVGHLTANQYPQKTQARPVYQSLDGDFKQSLTQLPAYQSLTKEQPEYVNHNCKEENSTLQPANYQALQQEQRKPDYQNLQEDSKKSDTVQMTTTYQALEKPVYQSLHTYGNA